MMEFLEFLNSSDNETLQKLPGITATRAQKIIAARPFSSQEDFSKVKGLGEKLFLQLQEEYRPTQVVDEPLKDEVTEEIAQTEDNQDEDSNAGIETPERKSILGRVITWIVVLLLLAGAVYAVIKWGIPFIYEKYIKPVENNAAEITDLASQQSTEVARLNEEIAALLDRVTKLEQRADAFDESLQLHDQSLAQLDSMQQLLDQTLTDQKAELLEQLSVQLTLTRGIEFLSRSRLYLSDSNFGLAKEDLQSSRDLLYTLLDRLPAEQVEALKVVINRLDMAISNLPAYPVVAVFDVDTAWQYLVDGLPRVPQQAVSPVVLPPVENTEPIPTEAPAVEATPEPTAEATTTP